MLRCHTYGARSVEKAAMGRLAFFGRPPSGADRPVRFLTSALSSVRAANAERCFERPSVETKDTAPNFCVLFLTTKLSGHCLSWSLRRLPSHVLWLTPWKARKNAC